MSPVPVLGPDYSMYEETMALNKLAVIIPAAGQGQRMGAGKNKALLALGGVPVLIRTVRAFTGLAFVGTVLVVVRPAERGEVRSLLDQYGCQDVALALGGETRQESVYEGLRRLNADYAWVAIHDAARPLVATETIQQGYERVQHCGAVGVGVPVKDTVKVVEGTTIVDTPERSNLWLIQTPQFFSYPLILQAHETARSSGWQGTDDCSLVERSGSPVSIMEGDYSNIKVTTPEDIPVAEALLGAGKERSGATVVGFGYDVHRLAAGRTLILCGVEIPYERGLAGHSDADVALHALMDALLGAAGLGDIGHHFPDTDPQYAGICSMDLLRQTVQRIKERGWQVENADITVAAQEPKLAPHIPAMQEKTAAALGRPVERINVKATTTEGLGFVGEGRGMAAYAVVSLKNGQV